MDENKPVDNNTDVSFVVDGSLINTHLLAVSKDETRISLTPMCFEHKNGSLHIKSCDGRMLFHTTIPDKAAGVASEEEWVLLVDIPSKLKANKRRPFYVVKLVGDVVKFTNIAANEYRLFNVVKDVTYPNTIQVETIKAREPTRYNPFKPEMLSAVYEYVGEEAYSHPMCSDNGDEAPYQFKASYGDGMVKLATIMPIKPTRHKQ